MLGENLKKMRESFGYTQAFIAEYLGLTAATLNQYDLYEEYPEKRERLFEYVSCIR